jgi:hypothetical protein
MDCGLDVWQDECDRIGSPLSSSQIQAVYEMAPNWAAQMLATGVKETELGKTARGAYNMFNIFNQAGNAPVDFDSWEEGASSWVMRFLDPEYKGGVYLPREATIEHIVSTYQGGPGCWESKGVSCANGETWTPCYSGSIELSIQQFVARTNTFMGLSTETPWTPVPGGAGCEESAPGASPPVYNLFQHGNRWGISPQEAAALASFCFPSRSGSRISGVVIHVQEGTTAGSLDWWLYGGGQASSTVMANLDGSIVQVVDEQDGPWTNGDVCGPNADGSRFMAQCGQNPNCCSLTIESEGYWNQAHPKAQVDAIAWQIRQWFARYGLTCASVYVHRDLNSCSRPNCCGSTIYNAVMSALGCPDRW